jgi:electron transport complex protein RnfG
MLSKSILRNSIILGAFAIVTAATLAYTHSSTKDRIVDQELKAARDALNEIIEESRHDNDLLATLWLIPQELLPALGLKEQSNGNIATKNGETVAVILPSVAPDGYSGDIKLLIGINVDGSVAGVRALSHKETPGLGDKIDKNKSEWVYGFNGKSIFMPEISRWLVKKDGGDFDQFTGATITPRAVVNRVKQTLLFYQNHQHLITQSVEDEKTP